MFTVDDAIEFMIEQISSPRIQGRNHGLQDDNHTVILMHILQNYIRRELPNIEGSTINTHFPEYSQPFLDAAHELQRRGIFRLGPLRFQQGQHRHDLESHYVLTEFGKKWIAAREAAGVPPMEPGRYPQLIGEYAKVFGPGFQQRATEAIKCYEAQAYLACCAMVGAAAESILLHVATRKANNEAEVLRQYKTSGGAGKIKNMILAGRTNPERQHFEEINELMKYWRDESAHGTQSNLSELEAYMSLHHLVRHATYVRDHIDVYTQD